MVSTIPAYFPQRPSQVLPAVPHVLDALRLILARYSAHFQRFGCSRGRVRSLSGLLRERGSIEERRAAAAGVLGDLWVFDIAAIAWRDLTGVVAPFPNAARYNHVLITVGSKLYMFGGYHSTSGTEPAHCMFRRSCVCPKQCQNT